MRQRGKALAILIWAVTALTVSWLWLAVGSSAVTNIVTVLSLLAVLTPLLPVWPWKWLPETPETSTPEQIERAIQELVVVISSQWEIEARRRQLDQPTAMPIGWRLLSSAIGTAAGRASALPPSGQTEQLINRYIRHPRQLVVLGEPGSGKTGFCVLLTLRLLKGARTSQVPLLLQIATWDPEESLQLWMARAVLDQYPFLENPRRYGRNVAYAMLAQKRFVFILDGLDEMPESRRAKACEVLRDDISNSQPIILTCRTRAYEEVQATQIIDLPTVELLPLSGSATAGYLLETVSGANLDRWEPVLDYLLAAPKAPLTQVLSNPLMLFLARSSYRRPDTTPADLLDPQRFGTADALNRHLLDLFVNTAFQSRKQLQPPHNVITSRTWDPRDARRWLSFIARHTERLNTQNIAWWRLYLAVPQSLYWAGGALVGGAACAGLAWTLFALFGRGSLGLVFGLAVGVFGGLLFAVLHQEVPRRLVPRLPDRSELTLQSLVSDLWIGVAGALVGATITIFIYRLEYGIVVGAFFGIVFGVSRRFTEPTEPKEAISPRGIMVADRNSVFYGAALGAVGGGFAGGFLGSFVETARYQFVFELNAVGRTALGALVGALLGGVGLGLIFHVTSAWGRFNSTRLYLFLGRVTPLRLMDFLEDAQRVGILRQEGAYFQFRHALLRQRLAEDDEPDLAEPGRKP